MLAHPRPLIEVFAANLTFVNRVANVILSPPSSRWRVVRCCVAIAARVPWPQGDAIMVRGSPRPSASPTTPPVPRRSTRSFGACIATRAKRPSAPGPTVWSAVCPQPRRRLRSRSPRWQNAGAQARGSRDAPLLCTRAPRGGHAGPTRRGRHNQCEHGCSDLLCQLGLAGRVVTMDALLTQRHVAPTMVDKGGDSVMTSQTVGRSDAPISRWSVRCRQRATGKRPHARWTAVMGASSSAIAPRVRPWWAATGPVWRRGAHWGGMSSHKKRLRNGWQWSMGPPVCAPSGEHPRGCSNS